MTNEFLLFGRYLYSEQSLQFKCFFVKAEMNSFKIVLIYLLVVAGVHLCRGQCLDGWGSVFGCRKVCNKIFLILPL